MAKQSALACRKHRGHPASLATDPANADDVHPAKELMQPPALDPPVDRPNLSKDYLAGEAQDDWIPLWPNDFYVDQRIELVLGRRVSSIDTGKRIVRLDAGSERQYGALLLATGARAIAAIRSTPAVHGPQRVKSATRS